MTAPASIKAVGPAIHGEDLMGMYRVVLAGDRAVSV